MSQVYTVTQMKKDEKDAARQNNVKIANEFLSACDLNPDEDVKKLVLTNASVDTKSSIVNAYDTAVNITPAVAKIAIPGLAANVKILQAATNSLANANTELENELEIVTEQRDELQTRLLAHENPTDIDNMLERIRKGREIQQQSRPKQSQIEATKKALERAVRREVQRK